MNQRVEADYKSKLIIYFRENHRLPSFSELQDITHYRSKGGVSKLVDKLEVDGFLQRDRKGKLVPGQSFFSLPFPGRVQAGFPSPADQGFDEVDRIDLYDFLVSRPNDTFIHRVSGDSMIDAGINEGDWIISERSSNARSGQLVIAEVAGEVTVKRYMIDDSGVVYLKAENPEHSDIYSEADTEITIMAIVRSIIRQFK